jgi:Regulator of Chromosome Condensation (RCC1) repeat protein
MVSVCADGACQIQVATAGTLPVAQVAGDCQELICDGRGTTVARDNLGDTPADDSNECTDEVCSPSGPEHAPLVAGAKCGEAGVCNGKGRCGVCLPEVARCEKNAAQTCSEEGQWSPAVACTGGTPICATGRCSGIAAMALGAAHGCVVLDGGGARCSGIAAAGQLARPSPRIVSLPPVSALAVGSHHRCALLGDATVRCWGNNATGELGDGTSEGRPAPIAAVGVEGATQLAAGDGHTCARLAKGTVICWGHDEKGQLGDAGGAPPSNATVHPMAAMMRKLGVEKVLLAPEFASFALGGNTTCGLRGDGKVDCWGDLAIDAAPAIPGKPAPSKTTPKPRLVAGLKGVTAVALGGDHSCALLQDGSATCWGDNEKGQLGDGSPAKKHAPAKVKGLAGVVELALGRDHTCARLADATVQCWGGNGAGQLGDGTTKDRRVPAVVPGIAGAAAIVAAGDRTCARLESGSVLCWGDDADGAIGGANPSPTAVTW